MTWYNRIWKVTWYKQNLEVTVYKQKARFDLVTAVSHATLV